MQGKSAKKWKILQICIVRDCWFSCSLQTVLEHCQESVIEVFGKNSQQFLAVSYFLQKDAIIDNWQVFKYTNEKQPSWSVHRKRYSENMHQIYRITLMPKCFAILLTSHFGMTVLLKIPYFQNSFSQEQLWMAVFNYCLGFHLDVAYIPRDLLNTANKPSMIHERDQTEDFKNILFFKKRRKVKPLPLISSLKAHICKLSLIKY